MLFAPRCRRARSEKAVICFCPCLYQVFSHILGVSLPPSRRFHPLYAVPPPSSEGGKGAPAPCTEILLVSIKSRGWRCEGAPAPCTEILLVSIKSRGWCGFSPRVDIFTKIYIKNSPPHFEKAQKESSGPFAVGYSEKTPGTTVQRAPTFPRPTANGSCGGSIPQNACFGTEWKG